jgi:type II secretory pathway component PulM
MAHDSSQRSGSQPTTLAEVIHQAREAAGLSIRQLAPLVGKHHSVRLIQDSAIDLVRPVLSCNDQLSIKVAE